MKDRAQSRKPVLLSESTQRRLGAYALAASAAGVSLPALAPPAAEAKVVYTKAHVVLQSNQPVALDFNHDGINDFFLVFKGPEESVGGGFYEYLAACHRTVPGSRGNECISSASSTYNPANAIRVNKTDWAKALAAGKAIEKGERFKDKTAAQMGNVLWEASTTRTVWGGPWVDGGKGVKNRYLGVRFKFNGHSHFAWVRLTVTTTPPHDFKAKLTGYAYETVPGKPIIAGKTQGPEVITLPMDSKAGTLGQLALGRK